MKKRILSLLLVACMLAGLLPTAAFAAEPEEALYAQMLELGLVDADGEDQRGSNSQITVSLCNSICGSVHGFIQFSRSVVTVPGMHR